MNKFLYFTILALLYTAISGCSTTTSQEPELEEGDVNISEGLKNGTIVHDSDYYSSDRREISKLDGKIGIFLRNTINVSLAENRESLIKDNNFKKLYTNAEVESFYFDPLRVLNNFATIKFTHFPQEYKSKIKMVVLESLQGRTIKNICINKEGFIELVDIDKTTKIAQTPIEKDGNNNIANNEIGVLHDLLVTIPVTKGIKSSEAQNFKIDGHLGYARSNNTKIRYFKIDAEVKKVFESSPSAKELKTRAEKCGENVHIADLEKTFLEELNKLINDNVRVISASYGFKENELERLYPKEECSISNLAQCQESIHNNLLKNKDKYILLTALDNEIDGYDEEGRRSELRKFHKAFENNLILVSASKFDVTAKSEENMFTRRENLVKPSEKSIEFFTILGDYNIAPTNLNDESTLSSIVQWKGTSEPVGYTSFATPVLARIIFNMLSLSPNMSSAQVKDILRKSALNYSDYKEDKAVGYIVNPEKAYEFTLGSLMANAQAHSYKKCENAIIELNNVDNGIEFVVDCETNSPTNFENHKYNNDLTDFYKNADVYKSRYRSEGNIFTFKRDTPIERDSSNPRKITIRNLKIDYGKCEPSDVENEECKDYKVTVTFEKIFDSVGYNDITTKIMVIDYGQGDPQLEKEYAVDTRSVSR